MIQHIRRHSIIFSSLAVLLLFSSAGFAQNTDAEQVSRVKAESKIVELKTPVSDSMELKEPEKNVSGEVPNAVIEKSENLIAAESNDSARHFFRSKTGKKQSEFSFLTGEEKKDSPLRIRRVMTDSSDDDKSAPSADEKFQWRAAMQQSLMFLGVQHGYAFTQLKTRRALKGKFFADYADSVKALHGWDDGGRFFTNYIAHPMQGSLTGFIYIQNSPQARRQQFGQSSAYWSSRMKAMAWTAAWSTQFEIGPISQASIGNVGLKGKQTWGDIVVTPTIGTALLVTEDALDRFVTQRIERRTDNLYVKIFSRMLLSPTRVFANLLRFETPWYRDRPTAH